jgi:hypothetical protein
MMRMKKKKKKMKMKQEVLNKREGFERRDRRRTYRKRSILPPVTEKGGSEQKGKARQRGAQEEPHRLPAVLRVFGSQSVGKSAVSSSDLWS